MLSSFSSIGFKSASQIFIRSFAHAAYFSVSNNKTEENAKLESDELYKQNPKAQSNSNQNPTETKEPKPDQNPPPKPTYEELESQNNDLKNQNLYLLADVENSRRRFERLARELENTAIFSMAKQLLPLADNIRRIRDSGENQTVGSVLEAVGIVDSELHAIFKNFKIERLNSKGIKFNPEFHDAIATIPGKPEESGNVIDVINEGYTINGKLLRAAKVVVVK